MGKIGSVKVGWDQPFLPPKNVREGGANLFLVLLLMHYYTSLHFPKREKKRNLSLLSSPFAVTTPIAFACVLLPGGEEEGSGCFLPPTLLLLTISLTAEKKNGVEEEFPVDK